MNISNSNVALTNQSSSAHRRPQGPAPKEGKEQLSAALQSIGVDEATKANVLTQIDEAISVLESESSSGTITRDAIRSTINDVLESNGIDETEVNEAIQSNSAVGSGNASASGRPNRPPPPPRQDESETSTLESLLLSSGLDESSTDELISQIVDTLEELTDDSTGKVSVEDIQSALNSVLEDNGVDVGSFEEQIASTFDLAGLFLDRLA
tara:strand:- start:589108 stop:589737 length:630 start_codon:yes stop_codon:yes gene_type:complete